MNTGDTDDEQKVAKEAKKEGRLWNFVRLGGRLEVMTEKWGNRKIGLCENHAERLRV